MTTGDTGKGRMNDAGYYLIAITVGAITGLIGSALHIGVDKALAWPGLLRDYLRDNQVVSFVDVDGHSFLLLTGCASALAVIVAVWLVRRFAPEAGGSGVQEIEGAMAGLREVRWLRVLMVKFFGGFLALGSGLVIGREGPTIHMGASVAQAANQWFGLSQRDTRGLLAAGAAAGLAAAFNAPLAAILFVIEETRRQFPYGLRTYTAVMLASVASGVVTEGIGGIGPDMLIAVPELPLGILPAFIGLGVLLGVLGVVFNRALIWSLDLSLAIGKRLSFYLVPAIVGFAIGILLILRPEATMGGERLVVTMVNDHLPLTILAIIVGMRFVMTMASYSTGVPGGIFAPILALATATGLLYGSVLEMFVTLPPGALAALAVAGMGGLFSSTVRAPLVGVVLVAELTGAYTVLVPAILTCLFANLVADALGGEPIYETLLNRTLRLAGQAPQPQEQGTDAIGGWDQYERQPQPKS